MVVLKAKPQLHQCSGQVVTLMRDFEWPSNIYFFARLSGIFQTLYNTFGHCQSHVQSPKHCQVCWGHGWKAWKCLGRYKVGTGFTLFISICSSILLKLFQYQNIHIYDCRSFINGFPKPIKMGRWTNKFVVLHLYHRSLMSCQALSNGGNSIHSSKWTM